MATIEFVLQRAAATRAVQDEIKALWQWDEKTVAQWDEAIDGVRAQQDTVSDALAAMREQRGELDAALGDLHDRTVQALGVARLHCRRDPQKLEMLANLSARGASRAVLLEEARELESAWERIAVDWSPSAANTLAAFKTLRTQCEDLMDEYAAAQSEWREQTGKLNVMVAEFDDANVTWYSEAVRIFPEGTAEGDLIRGTIPTTYSPPPTPPAPPPEPPPTPPNP